jgi:hypothetical protein
VYVPTSACIRWGEFGAIFGTRTRVGFWTERTVGVLINGCAGPSGMNGL